MFYIFTFFFLLQIKSFFHYFKLLESLLNSKESKNFCVLHFFERKKEDLINWLFSFKKSGWS